MNFDLKKSLQFVKIIVNVIDLNQYKIFVMSYDLVLMKSISRNFHNLNIEKNVILLEEGR